MFVVSAPRGRCWAATWRPGRCHLRRRAGCRVPKAGFWGADTAQAHVGSWAARGLQRTQCSDTGRRGRSAPHAVGLRAPPPSARRPGPADRRPDRPQTTAISGEKRPLFLSRDALSWGQRGGAAPAPPDRLGSEAQMRPPRGRAAGWDAILTLRVKRCRSRYLGAGRLRWGVRAGPTCCCHRGASWGSGCFPAGAGWALPPPTPYPLPGVAHPGAQGAHGRSPGARSEQGPCLVAFGLDHP